MKVQFTQRKRGIAILASVTVLLALCPPQAYALFGVEDTVEPGPIWTTQLVSQYAALGHIWSQDVTNYTKLVETVLQLEKIYSNGMQMYNLGMAMSHSFSGPNKAQWITVAQMAANDYTHDQYGENGTWSSAVSGNPKQVPSAWQMSTVALNDGVNLANETPGHSSSLARLASIESLDGSSTKCLQTISQYRGNSLANQLGPILKLAIARADGTAGTNSEVQQLNILAAQHEQGNNEAFAQGQINACLVEQQVLANKMQRDNQVDAFNTYAQVQQNYASRPMQLSSVSGSLDADIQ